MFIATVTVDLYRAGMHNGERVVIDLGLSDEDALFAYEKSWHKVANVVRQFTPYKFIVRDVHFSAKDTFTLIGMAKGQDDDFVLTCEECGSTSVCEHIIEHISNHTCGLACGSAGYCVVLD